MTKEQSELLSLLSHKLFNKPTEAAINDDVKREAEAQAVSTLITSDYKILGKIYWSPETRPQPCKES